MLVHSALQRTHEGAIVERIYNSPYSAAQMITPEELQSGSGKFDGKQLRRIEIRVRRKQ